MAVPGIMNKMKHENEKEKCVQVKNQRNVVRIAGTKYVQQKCEARSYLGRWGLGPNLRIVSTLSPP